MFYLEFDEDRLTKTAEATGDAYMNAVQFADMMASDERIAAFVAASIAWYAHLTEGVDAVTARKRMEVVEDDPHNYLIEAAELI